MYGVDRQSLSDFLYKFRLSPSIRKELNGRRIFRGGYSTALGCVVRSLADSRGLWMIPSRYVHRFNQNGEWLSKTSQKRQKTRDIWRNSRGSFTSLDYAWTGFGKINHIPTVQIILLPALSAFTRHENQP